MLCVVVAFLEGEVLVLLGECKCCSSNERIESVYSTYAMILRNNSAFELGLCCLVQVLCLFHGGLRFGVIVVDRVCMLPHRRV
jgi:hypothetical protein